MERMLRLIAALERIPPSARRWAYRVGAAVLVLLAGAEVLTEADAARWALLVGAVLGAGELGMAARNTTVPEVER